MNLKAFKKIVAQVNQLEKSDIKFDVALRFDQDWVPGCDTVVFEPVHYVVKSLKQLSEIQETLGKPIKLKDNLSKVAIEGFKPKTCITNVSAIKTKPAERLKYPTLKFYTDEAKNILNYGFEILIINEEPSEQEENKITYRYIGDDDVCLFCIPHTHALYNYLDKNFFLMRIIKHNEKERIVITNELTLDSYLVLAALWLQSDLSKHLTDGCFVNANNAKLLRIKMEKSLLAANKTHYDRLKVIALKLWEKDSNLDIIRKLAQVKVPHSTYNHIRLTQKTASYETVSIAADNLIEVIQSHIILDDRTDIYTIVRGYINYIIENLEQEDLIVKEDKDAAVAEYKLVINGINITLKRTSENTRRYINGVTINKAELETVAFRASCFDTQENFDKFVGAVSKMSLKWHDTLANGLGVKIHDGMTAEDLRRAEAPLSAPRIKFKKVGKDFHLVIDENKSAKIKFSAVQQQIATLNRKTNNGFVGYARRNAEWARRRLKELLISCCTFETTEKVLDEKGKQIIDVVKQLVLKPDGTPETEIVDGVVVEKSVLIKTPRVLVKNESTLSDEDAGFIEKMARDYQLKAIEKSKVALDLALKRTGAKLIDFQGEEGYLVEGSLRKYVVNKKTNQVYNYEKGNYICIVEPGHQISVGFDALASRLYALKNDSMMVKHVGTLSHG